MTDTITGPDILRYQAAVIKTALLAHIRSRGRLRVTRTASPGRLLQTASRLTKVQYRRGQYLKAISDLSQIIDPLESTHNP